MNKKSVLSLVLLFALASCNSFVANDETSDNNFNYDDTVGEDTIGGSGGSGSSSQPTKNKYQVIFYNDKTELYRTSVNEGSKVSYLGNPPTKTGTSTVKYTFFGWSEDSEADYSQALSISNLPPITKDSVFFAIFKKSNIISNSYTATFYSNPGEVYTTVTKTKGQKILQSDLGRSDTPVANYEEGKKFTFQAWNKIGDDDGKYYRFDASSGILNMSDDETQSDISFIAKYYAQPVTYECNFCSYDGNPLFSFDLDHGIKPSNSKNFMTDAKKTVNRKYFEPSYCVDGRKYSFVGWSTTKGDSVSNAKSINDLPEVYKAQPYYAIVDLNNSEPVFLEITGEEENGHYQVLTYEEALSGNYFQMNGTELTSFFENKVVSSNIYQVSKVPYNLFISDSRIKTLGKNSLSSISSGSIRSISISSVETIKENAFTLFNYDSDYAIAVDGKNVTTIQSKAFYNSGLIQYVSLPKISVIPENCFEQSQIVEARLDSDNLTKISKNAFYKCTKLKKINIGKNVSTIEFDNVSSSETRSPFSNDTNNSNNVQELSVNSANQTYRGENNALIRKSDNALIFATNGTTTIPSSVKKIAKCAFDRLVFSTATINIPVNVESIEENAFNNSPVQKIVFKGTKAQFKNICSKNFYNCTQTQKDNLVLDFTDAMNQKLSSVFS